ncbi:MFS transporter [Kribbella sp. ALI-6-A]|uniref:MFS transporter n=1 Tax=Kribbella sp. ALI-6-A TaxID=1933817 RepID=UPI00097C33D2|nr:MFS transporter [Kribbella sp. ALI-6-A]ONI73764.1 MFS transporter [Kribbella sp. ALI-6-A]
MGARRDAVMLLAGGAAADFAFRIAQVALPLVVLHETGSVAATGLAGGAAGIPVVLSPWWARRARQWVDSGPRLAMVAAVAAAALAIVPGAAALGALSPALLILSGLLLGCADALSNPGRSALLADTGDRWGVDRAVLLLTWQDGLRRVGMLVGPPIGAVAVATGLANTLLWIEAATVLGAGALAVRVKPERAGAAQHAEQTPGAEPAGDGGPEAPSIRASLRGRPDILYGWIARGTGCLTWFAFTLGLSVIGAERGQPGVYLAAGMSGYGAGALLGTVVSLAVVRRLPPIPVAALAWTAMGLCWVGMGVWTTPAVVAVLGALSGVTVVLGIAAISVLITRTSYGAERRALLSGQSVVVNASSSAGLFVGGPIIATAGAEATLVGAGLLTSAVALAVLVRRGARTAEPRVLVQQDR